MAELKIFISHSSRLDDVNGATDSEENWTLLQEICDEINEQDLGVDINILIDQVIGSGEDWEKHLNLWLAECHAAIILYSKRALKKSDWVKKEATILNWRWQVETNFPLLPVFFEDETGIEDAKDSFWKTIGLQQVNSATCPRDASSIVSQIKNQASFKQLVTRLKSQEIPTPFTEIAEELKILLEDDRIFSDLRSAWDKLHHGDKPNKPINSIDDLVNNLIRFLLTSPSECMQKLYDFSSNIVKKETRDTMQQVHGAVRAIWVNAGAASKLPPAQKGDVILALNGIHLNDSASRGLNTTKYFTVDRYIKRIWHKDIKGVLVPITDQTAPEDIETEIWRHCWPSTPNSKQENLRKRANRQEFIVVYLPAKDATTGLPDIERAREIIALRQFYPKLRILIGTGAQPLTEQLPGIHPLDPALDIEFEDDQYLDDCELERILRS